MYVDRMMSNKRSIPALTYFQTDVNSHRSEEEAPVTESELDPLDSIYKQKYIIFKLFA